MRGTESMWPSSVCTHLTISASQILTVRSPEVDASYVESCENTAE